MNVEQMCAGAAAGREPEAQCVECGTAHTAGTVRHSRRSSAPWWQWTSPQHRAPRGRRCPRQRPARRLQQGKQSREHTSASTRSRGQQQGEPMESHGRCHTLCRLSAPGPGGRPAPVVFSVHLQARGQAASRAAVGSGRHNTTGGRAEHKAERPAGIAAEHTKPLWCLPLCVMRQLSRNSSTSRAAPARPPLTRSTGPAGWPQGPAQWRPCRRCPHPHPPLPAQPGGLSVAAARRAGLPTGEASRKI